MVNAPEETQPAIAPRRSRDRTLTHQDAAASGQDLNLYNQMLANYLTQSQIDQHLRPSYRSEYSHYPTLQSPYTSQPPQAHEQIQQQFYYHSQQQLPPQQQQQQQQQQRRSEPHHRVYILRCARCDAFMSDRGMRAVLLLKPHITLFSTDATPVNCGALYEGNSEEPDELKEKVERTCSCLTQSLGCHSCGNINGYQIISPCSRCTASVTKHQRPANGHRFVFHHNEVTFSERRYFPGEKGVRTDLVRHVTHQEKVIEQHLLSSAEATEAESDNTTETDADAKDSRDRLSTQVLFASSRSPTLLSSSISSTSSTSSSPLLSSRTQLPKGLQEGDTVYWHYLVSSGELTNPFDPRSRCHTSYSIGR